MSTAEPLWPEPPVDGAEPASQEIGQPDVPGRPAGPAKSTAELTSDLARQVTRLVHHEMELARMELSAKGRRAGLGSGLFGAAGVLALVGLGAFAACAIAAVHVVLPIWAAALVVGAFLEILAGAFALLGGGELRRATPPLPTEAIEHAKEDVAWIRTHARSGTR